jgi:cell division transport system permease protein
LLRRVRWSATSLAVALLSTVAFVVVATMRLALESRKEEIEIFRLAGATERWIRAPFWIEGAALGAVAGAVAWLAAAAIGSRTGTFDLPPLIAGNAGGSSMEFVPSIARSALLFVGPVLGGGGAWIATRWALGKA